MAAKIQQNTDKINVANGVLLTKEKHEKVVKKMYLSNTRHIFDHCTVPSQLSGAFMLSQKWFTQISPSIDICFAKIFYGKRILNPVLIVTHFYRTSG